MCLKYIVRLLGDGPAKKYVPPSEQTVPEPKKYTGSAIPSRSFKMLQAMTSPDMCGKLINVHPIKIYTILRLHEYHRVFKL